MTRALADRADGLTFVTGGGLYEVTKADRHHRGMINRRREMISPIDGMDVVEHASAIEELFPLVGLSDFASTRVAEMPSRPTVEATAPGTYAATLSAYTDTFPMLLEWILSRTERLPYTFNNKSRVGAPVIAHVDSKRDLLIPEIQDALSGGDDAAAHYTDNGWTMINVRLQPEKAGRVREMTFISDSGEIHREQITERERFVTNKDGDVSGFAQRTRDIFMPHKANLATGIVDAALHRPLLRSVVCGHNMFGGSDRLVPAACQAVLCTDIRHMDRYTGECVRFRTDLIGGVYAAWMHAMLDQPYLCPSDSWASAWWVRVLGVAQLPSGVSPVAGIQKELNLCVYTRFLSETRHISQKSAFDLVMAGGDVNFTIRNYGDDNLLAGDHAALASWLDFAKDYFAIEEEVPPKFLGFTYDPADRAFFLDEKSYFKKTWLNERPPQSMWRPNSNYGWVQRRAAFRQYGRPTIERFFAIEDAMLERRGLPWRRIEARAQEEFEVFGSDGPLGYGTISKPYLVPNEQRHLLPGFETVDERTVTDLARRMVGAEIRKSLFPSMRAPPALAA